MLIRAGIGRNAVVASLGVSKNTVKTIMRRIRHKLGEDWVTNPSVLWPPQEDRAESARAEIAEAGPGGSSGCLADLPAIAREDAAKRTRKILGHQRRLSITILIRQSSNYQTAVVVSGAQRFWLKPALKYLTEARYLRFLYVDHFDIFAPPWLPLVNRGRGAVKAAAFATTNEHHVLNYLSLYVEQELPEYVDAVSQKLEKVKNMTAGYPRAADLPSRENLLCLARECLGQGNSQA